MNFTKECLQLYAVTDRMWTGRQTLFQQVETALKGGVTCVQLREKNLDEIDIAHVDLEFAASVTLQDIYHYMLYLSRERSRHPNSPSSALGLNEASRARKLSSIRSFYHYLSVKTHQISENPAKDADSPRMKKSLPKYLTLEDSLRLLSNVSGRHQERDYCVLTLFLNCGLRISELTGLNLSDIQGETLRVRGKGGKTRILILNEACQDALQNWIAVRRNVSGHYADALFLSERNQRISRAAVHHLVKKHLNTAGLDSKSYSSHKLRHTALFLCKLSCFFF